MKEKNQFTRGALLGAFAMFLAVVVSVAGGWALKEVLQKKEIPQIEKIAPKKDNEDSKEEALLDKETLKKLLEIQGIIDKYYLYEDELDTQKMKDGLCKGLLYGLEDLYAAYYDTMESKEVKESFAGSYSGTGATMSQDQETGIITITEVPEGSPATEGGLMEGDILIKVDGEDVRSMDLGQVVNLVKGEDGTTVKLTVLRGEDEEEVTLKIIRRTIEKQTVDYAVRDGISYIRIDEFDDVTLEQFQSALAGSEEEGMEGLVIDLRGNPGGNLDTVCEVLDLLLPKGLIVYTEDKEGNRDTYTSDEEHQFNKPMVVLVDESSASASEIFAGAVQDYERGVIMGVTTYGKGVVQNLFTLSDGTILKFTTEEYFTPKGRNIHKKGIEPDIEVEYDEESESDNQLEEAIRHVRKMIEEQ